MPGKVNAASVLSAAIGLAIGLQAAAVAQDMGKEPATKDNPAHGARKPEKCYGINAIARNDCSEGAHSCAGQATMARDPKSFVLLPAGDCVKIEGGKTKST